MTSDSPIDPDGPQPFPVATRITVTNGQVTEMQQYKAQAQLPSHSCEERMRADLP